MGAAAAGPHSGPERGGGEHAKCRLQHPGRAEAENVRADTEGELPGLVLDRRLDLGSNARTAAVLFRGQRRPGREHDLKQHEPKQELLTNNAIQEFFKLHQEQGHRELRERWPLQDPQQGNTNTKTKKS